MKKLHEITYKIFVGTFIFAIAIVLADVLI